MCVLPASNSAELLLAAGRFLNRREPEPGGEIAALAKFSVGGTRAAIAVAEIGPTPGMVISQRATGSVRVRRVSTADSDVDRPGNTK